jgi:hypothetical protein
MPGLVLGQATQVGKSIVKGNGVYELRGVIIGRLIGIGSPGRAWGKPFANLALLGAKCDLRKKDVNN